MKVIRNDDKKKHKKNKNKKSIYISKKKYNKLMNRSWSGKILDCIDIKVNIKSKVNVSVSDDSLNHAITTGASLVKELISKSESE